MSFWVLLVPGAGFAREWFGSGLGRWVFVAGPMVGQEVTAAMAASLAVENELGGAGHP